LHENLVCSVFDNRYSIYSLSELEICGKSVVMCIPVTDAVDPYFWRIALSGARYNLIIDINVDVLIPVRWQQLDTT